MDPMPHHAVVARRAPATRRESPELSTATSTDPPRYRALTRTELRCVGVEKRIERQGVILVAGSIGESAGG